MPFATAEKRKEYMKNYGASWRRANRDKFWSYQVTYRQRRPERVLLAAIKRRAKKLGIECNIEESDIIIPERCPVFGITLMISAGRSGGKPQPNAPSVDRIDPSRGYVKGNVQVISWRANSLKKDASPEEIRLLANFMSRQ